MKTFYECPWVFVIVNFWRKLFYHKQQNLGISVQYKNHSIDYIFLEHFDSEGPFEGLNVWGKIRFLSFWVSGQGKF